MISSTTNGSTTLILIDRERHEWIEDVRRVQQLCTRILMSVQISRRASRESLVERRRFEYNGWKPDWLCWRIQPRHENENMCLGCGSNVAMYFAKAGLKFLRCPCTVNAIIIPVTACTAIATMRKNAYCALSVRIYAKECVLRSFSRFHGHPENQGLH